MLSSLKHSSRSILKVTCGLISKRPALYHRIDNNFTTSKAKKSPFLNPAQFKNDNNNTTDSHQNKAVVDILSDEIKDAIIKQNDSALANDFNKRFSTIDSLFILSARNTASTLNLTRYKGISGFIEQQVDSLADEMKQPIEDETYRMGIKLCAIYLMVQYKNTSNKVLHYTMVKELAEAIAKGDLRQRELDDLYRDALMNLVHIVSFIQTNIIASMQFKYPLGLLAEFLLRAARSKNFYLDHYIQISKEANFIISKKTSKHLRWLNYLITLSLNSSKPSPQLVKLTQYFLQNMEFLIRIFDYNEDYELPLRIMNTLIAYCRITWTTSSNEFSDLTAFALEILISNIKTVDIPKLSQLSDTFRNFGIFTSQISLYHKFWFTFLNSLITKKDEIPMKHWITMIYHIGTIGFMTPEFLKKVFHPMISPANYSTYTKHPDFPKYIVNLLQVGLKNKFITVQDFYKHKDTLVKIFAATHGWTHDKGKVYLQLCNMMCRSDIFDYELWEPFFSNINSLIASEGNSSFKIKYIYQHIEMFSDSAELKRHQKTIEAFTSLPKKSKTLRDLLEIPVSHLGEKNILGQQDRFVELLKQANIKFTSNTFIGNHKVTCVIPDQKLVVDVYGYRDYVKPLMEKTLLTEYGEKVISKLGYKLVVVPLAKVPEQETEISPDLELFRQLEKYYPVNG